MNKLLFPLLAIAVMMTGCKAKLEYIPFEHTSYQLGETYTRPVGNTFLRHTKGLKIIKEGSLDDGEEKIVEGSFKKELIYTGVQGRVITMQYREYATNFKNPSFLQDLTYDLSISDTLSFQNYTIRILAADNQAIRFMVVNDTGKPMGTD